MNGGHDRYSQYGYNDNRRRYNDRSHANEEPEWFSGGPTSQNDTIELRGFEDPAPDKSPTPRSNGEADFVDEVRDSNGASDLENESDQRLVTHHQPLLATAVRAITLFSGTGRRRLSTRARMAEQSTTKITMTTIAVNGTRILHRTYPKQCSIKIA